jgi:hypothetical protein
VESSASVPGTVAGTRVSPSGTVIDASPVTLVPANDASGNVVLASVAYGGGAYLLAWQDSSSADAFQAVHVDPSNLGVLDSVPLGVAGSGYLGVAVAYGGGEFLVSWIDSSHDVLGARVTSALVDATPLTIPTTAGESTNAFDGTDFLVASVDPNGNAGCTRVTPTGSALPTAIASTALAAQQSPAVAYTNGIYLVAWAEILPTTESWDVLGARVRSSDGLVLDPSGFEIASSPNDDLAPAVAGEAGQFLVAWDETSGSGTSANNVLKGARVRARDGAVLDGTGVVLTQPIAGTLQLSVAASHTAYLLGWVQASVPVNAYAERIALADLTVLDTSPIALPPTGLTHISIASDGTDFCAAYNYSNGLPSTPALTGVLKTRMIVQSPGAGQIGVSPPAVTYGPADYVVSYIAFYHSAPVLTPACAELGQTYTSSALSFDGIDTFVAFRDLHGNWGYFASATCTSAQALPGSALPALASNGAGQTLAVVPDGNAITGFFMGTCDAGFCGTNVQADSGFASTQGDGGGIGSGGSEAGAGDAESGAIDAGGGTATSPDAQASIDASASFSPDAQEPTDAAEDTAASPPADAGAEVVDAAVSQDGNTVMDGAAATGHPGERGGGGQSSGCQLARGGATGPRAGGWFGWLLALGWYRRRRIPRRSGSQQKIVSGRLARAP